MSDLPPKKKLWALSYKSLLHDFKIMPLALKKCMKFYLSRKGEALLSKISELIDSLNFSRVLFIGNSFNFYASFIPSYSLMTSGVDLNFSWDSIELNEFYDYILPGKPDNETLYIFISKSGRSKLLVKSMEHLFLIKKDPRMIWLVTNEPKIKIAKKCGAVFPTLVSSELALGTKTFQNLVFVLYLISRLIMKKKPLNKSIQATVNNLIHSMKEYWAKNIKNPRRLLDFFENNIQFLYLVSKGASIGSAYEAAACAKSFTRIIAEGMSLGLFFHGTFQIADDKFRSVFIISNDLTSEENNLVNNLINQITEKSGLMLLISNNEDLTNSLTDDSHVLPIKFKCDIPSLTPIFEMYVLHLLLLEVAKIKDLIF